MTGTKPGSAWPIPNRVKDGAPNLLVQVLDDTGFGPLTEPRPRRGRSFRSIVEVPLQVDLPEATPDP